MLTLTDGVIHFSWEKGTVIGIVVVALPTAGTGKLSKIQDIN